MTRLAILPIFITAALLFADLNSKAVSDDKQKSSPSTEIVRIRIKFGYENSATNLVFQINDPKHIRELVTEPMRQAQVDPKPARYELMGSMTIEFKGGSTEGVALFLPWGRYNHKEKYMNTDFGALQKALKKEVEGIGRTLP